MAERAEPGRGRARPSTGGETERAPLPVAQAATAASVAARERAGGPIGRPPPGRRSAPPAVPERYRYSMQELEEQTGISARTIRYYVAKGLLAPAYGRGPTATYDLGHLLRLRLIRRLKDGERLPLAEIQARLAQLSDDDIEALLGVETQPAEDRWRRIALHPDIELHVRDRGGARPSDDQRFEEAVELIVGLVRPVVDRLGEG